jgi:hypothetical protein
MTVKAWAEVGVGVGESTECEKECIAIAKIETSERCNHAGVEIHTNTHM